MSEAVTETTESEAPAKQGSKKFLIIIVLAVVLLGGGGAGAYFFLFSAKSAAGSEEATKGKSTKKAKAADEEDTADDTSSKKSGSVKSALPKDEEVKKIIELQPFIVNLADENEARYLRLTVSLGIGGAEGGGEEKPDQLFVTRVRNAMLAVLSEKKSEDILSNEGKAKLRKELLKAAQAASEEPEVKAIYITDFIVQL